MESCQTLLNFQTIFPFLLATFHLLACIECTTVWVPRVGMMRVLRKPSNPYNIKIEPPNMLTRKNLLDSKSSEESSENTDDDDSPDTLEEYDGQFYKDAEDSQLGMYRRKAWRDFEDSNAAEEDYSDDLEPVITLPDRKEIFK